MLAGAGLVDAEVTDVTFTYRMASADEYWDSMLDGSVRASAQVRGQTAEVQQQIREAFDRLVAPYEVDGHLELPVVVKVGSGCAPSR
jgi:hypothetical protein